MLLPPIPMDFPCMLNICSTCGRCGIQPGCLVCVWKQDLRNHSHCISLVFCNKICQDVVTSVSEACGPGNFLTCLREKMYRRSSRILVPLGLRGTSSSFHALLRFAACESTNPSLPSRHQYDLLAYMLTFLEQNDLPQGLKIIASSSSEGERSF